MASKRLEKHIIMDYVSTIYPLIARYFYNFILICLYTSFIQWGFRVHSNFTLLSDYYSLNLWRKNLFITESNEVYWMQCKCGGRCMWFSMQCSAVQCSTLQCNLVQCSAVQCSTGTVQCSEVQVQVMYRMGRCRGVGAGSCACYIHTCEHWIYKV